MKFTYKPSPNYRTAKSTGEIMKDLTVCLLAVALYAVIYYSAVYGASYGLRVVIMLVCAIVSALATDAVFLKVRKEDVKKGILSSYSWVTAIILVLMTRINVSYYAIIVCTIIAVFFGKLVFGGFGQNIFNPAAFGEAVLMNTFSASVAEDFTTGATPTTVANSAGWMFGGSDLTSIANQFGGMGKMFLGQYTSTIGSTCALLLLVCLVFLIVEGDIDWQTPVFYIGTFFVEALIVGLMHGAGFSYAIFSLLAGGVLFGGVFMVTDPVTSPVSIPGRIVYAIGCASLTFIIRTKSNLSDGVLYAILLMNMLAPAIDKLFDSNQIKDAAKNQKKVLIASCVLVVLTLIVGATIGTSTSTASSGETTAAESSDTAESSSEYNVSCTEQSNDGSTAVYACTADGFGLVNDMGSSYSQNEATVTVDVTSGTVASVEVTHFGDTEGVGDAATTDEALSAYAGVSASDEMPLVSGATYTSTSIAEMVQAALSAASGN